MTFTTSVAEIWSGSVGLLLTFLLLSALCYFHVMFNAGRPGRGQGCLSDLIRNDTLDRPVVTNAFSSPRYSWHQV